MAGDLLTLGLIGAGGRTRSVYTNVADVSRGRARIACFYDTNPDTSEVVQALPGGAGARAARSHREVIEDSSVDAVMIGTPNALHTDAAVDAMRSGKPVYLEKPLAATPEDHRRLLAVQRETSARVVVGFVLRYTPFYSRVKEIVADGTLGKVLFVQATELMGIWLTADCYLRGWRAHRDVAGPLLLEKCCHDIDIINWLLGPCCETVYAFTDRTLFTPRPDRPERCGSCDDDACVYRRAGTSAEHAVDNTGQQIYGSGSSDLCVYNAAKDIADHTTVLARYQGGTHVSFNVTMGVARGERRIRIVGSKAQLSGCAEDNALVIEPLQQPAKPERIALGSAGSGGHYGGDSVLAEQFVKLLDDPEAQSGASIADGFESGIVCLAADESARTGTSINMTDFRNGLSV